MTFRRAALSVIALAIVGGTVFALVSIARLPLQPEYRTHVRITSIGYQGHRYSPVTALILFRSEGGLEGSLSMPPANLKCSVGDTVAAIQQGTVIELAPGACQKVALP